MAKVQAMWKANPRLRALTEAKDEARPVVTLSEAQNFFYLHKTELGEYIFDALVAGGYYARRPDRLRQFYAGVGILMGMLLALVGRFLAAPAAPWSAWVLSGILTSMVILGFGWFMPARSISGARALAKVRGFAIFLARVEKDHIERMEKSPELFEKYLPYAMALRVENRWAQAFASIAVQQPHWYRGRSGDFFSVDLVNDLNVMSNQTGHAMTPTDGAASES